MSVVRLRMYGVLLTTVMAATVPVFGAEASLHGRASGWLGASRDTSFLGVAGLRYLPEARFSSPISKELAFDVEASVNGFVSVSTRSLESTGVRVKPYRATVRVSSSRFEARAGLQKISFGSAILLRPLMWFDRVDPRDPLELTDGVYGLLARYYFQNNVNVWAWGLLGNSSPKGWEQDASVRWVPEPGARVQIPVPRGEVAATYHHRTVDYSQASKNCVLLDEQDEDRLGVDVKADLGIGLCLEGTLSRTTRHLIDKEEDPPVWSRAAVAGLDYTIGIGSGLSVLVEHMMVGSAPEPFGRGYVSDAHVSALMLSFPLGLLDNLRGMVYYDWKNEDPYSFLGWQRTLDNWIFSVGAFWNPSRPGPAIGAAASGAAGRGLRVDVVFNH
jgi:hypothetical protein